MLATVIVNDISRALLLGRVTDCRRSLEVAHRRKNPLDDHWNWIGPWHRQQRGRGGAKGAGVSAPRVAMRYGRISRGRKLQGRYIGLLRRLSGSVRRQVQAAARPDGVEAALALAGSLEAAGG